VVDAIADAGLVLPLLNCGIAIGSSRGQQAKWEQLAAEFYQNKEPFPLNWLETLPNAAAIVAARQIQTTAPVLSPMAACATGIWSIAQGIQLIQAGQCDRVLAGAIEAPITPLTLTGFERMGALAQTGAYPFDRDREGLVLGEGGAVLMLETIELAQQRHARIYGRILGFGLTADGYHVSAPEPESLGAIAAVQQCLARAGLPASQIDFIHAHGTATQLNDRNEAHLIQQLFPAHVLVSSTKGATGHTIGASGSLGAAFCLKALQSQLLPACIGLSQPEFDLNFVLTTQLASLEQALCFSFGFGGQNAVLALGRA
jgi:3-oxoacyl-[acyl-carrier-protein] synthase II